MSADGSANGQHALVELRRKPKPSRERASRDALLEALERASSPSRVLARPIDVVAYASDASFYRLVPRAVVQLASEEEVPALFRIAREHRIPLTFRAGGTSLSGQAVTDGILVDTSKYPSRIDVEEGGRHVRVGPSAIGGRVNATLASFGRRIGPDPASIDACMMGGILANNASGMCCGVEHNAYHTLASMRLVLPSGVVLDTSRPDADAKLEHDAPHVHEKLLALRARILADPELEARIRAKYRIKNTTGYSLNALVDHDTPAQILAHLMIGSEGTLGYVAEAVLRTIPELPFKRTGLLFFANAADAFASVPALARAGARAVEFMDDACLRTVPPSLLTNTKWLGSGAAALLVEYGYETESELRAESPLVDAVVVAQPTTEPASFTTDPSSARAFGRFARASSLRSAQRSVRAKRSSSKTSPSLRHDRPMPSRGFACSSPSTATTTRSCSATRKTATATSCSSSRSRPRPRSPATSASWALSPTWSSRTTAR
ncbi:putative D-lactate dehydrogenase, Fe-S protein, FAD/FMN-containing [Labilithrix luteola]|uniref:D-lactate dehydrogenase (cytochrome) n=1 Tax=Labilithrix luteola TaxID=1391654 RepID=A0A0K1PLP5_9BACT|nr:putative D-lactate dehydrogenase, Fe-S protein, FAD/FMN-containing [Labilithrix luteola]